MRLLGATGIEDKLQVKQHSEREREIERGRERGRDR